MSKDKKELYRERKRKDRERLRSLGLVQIDLWVPNVPAAKDKLREYAAQLQAHYSKARD